MIQTQKEVVNNYASHVKSSEHSSDIHLSPCLPLLNSVFFLCVLILTQGVNTGSSIFTLLRLHIKQSNLLLEVLNEQSSNMAEIIGDQQGETDPFHISRSISAENKHETK
jgi:hypothetical protein